MSDNIECSNCPESFSSYDEAVDHLVAEHGVEEDAIHLGTSPSPLNRPIPSGENQTSPANEPTNTGQVENPVRPFVENSEEAQELVDTVFDRYGGLKERDLSHRLRLIRVVAGLFLAVLTASTILTYQQILPGSAYTLLLGTLIGYLLTFLEEYI